jgi:CRP/FNR family transcriptional regulator
VLNPTTPELACDATEPGCSRHANARPRCQRCALASRCLPAALKASDVQRFEQAVQRCRTLVAGEHLFRVGDPFRWIVAVNAGCLKSYAVDSEGREHVMGFHFAGEIIGIDAIDADRHAASCVALSGVRVCMLPYAALLALARELPAVQVQLLRMLSRYTLGTTIMTGDFSAEERLAAFLVMVAARARRRDEQAADLHLEMSRQDIANYLRLAPETVSRILARFQKSGLVKADRRHIALLDPEGLGGIAACMNPWVPDS